MPVAALAAVAVVRIAASDEAWVLGLPVLPPGHVVSVSATPCTPVDVAELAARGYRFAGLRSSPLTTASACAADLIVSEDLIHDAPATWRQLLGAAERVFPLANGPVGRLFSGLVAGHEASRRIPAEH